MVQMSNSAKDGQQSVTNPGLTHLISRLTALLLQIKVEAASVVEHLWMLNLKLGCKMIDDTGWSFLFGGWQEMENIQSTTGHTRSVSHSQFGGSLANPSILLCHCTEYSMSIKRNTLKNIPPFLLFQCLADGGDLNSFEFKSLTESLNDIKASIDPSNIR